MNLRGVDLNLLLALDALLAERHVTRAANRIGISQPAMSNALNRLRHHFGDDLLVRTATGMQPTTYAEELREPVSQTLRQIRRVFEGPKRFEPATASMSLTLRMSDLVAVQLLPPLLQQIRKAAPGIALDVVHLSPAQTIDALERDDVQLAVSMGLEHPASIRSEVLMSDRMVCVMRRKHALATGRLSLKSFLAAGHLKVSMSPTDSRFVDDVLSARGRARRVALNVPHWLLVPSVLRESDLISVMPGRFAAAIVRPDLAIRDLPFASASFEWRAYRHKRHDSSGAVNWLCQRLMELSASV